LEVKIQIAKINCEDERVICEEAGIKSYPSLKYFENGIDVVIVGAASDFIGARDVDGIVDTMRNKNLPPVEPKSDVVTLTFDTFDSFLEHNLVTVVEFYAPWWYFIYLKVVDIVRNLHRFILKLLQSY
jgi:protein disulfide-isomerase A6